MNRAALYALVLIAAAVSCSRSTTEPQAKQETFPTTVGSTWVYEWTDHRHGGTDTVLVSLTGTRDVPSLGSAGILVAKHENRLDTTYVVASGDTVRFVPGGYLGSGRATFVLPLQAGAQWSPGPFDTSRVVQAGSISVPAGIFDEAFLVESRYGPITNTFRTASMWVVPGVGIVEEDRREYDLGPVADYDRKLLSYHIADP